MAQQYAVCFQTAYRELASIACRQRGKTLFLITHSATDEEYTDNLRFLIKHGMGGSDKDLREYIIIIQQATPSCLPSHHLRKLYKKCRWWSCRPILQSQSLHNQAMHSVGPCQGQRKGIQRVTCRCRPALRKKECPSPTCPSSLVIAKRDMCCTRISALTGELLAGHCSTSI